MKRPQALELIVEQIAAKAGVEPIHVAAVLLRALSASLAHHMFIGEAQARGTPAPTIADELSKTDGAKPRSLAEWFDAILAADTFRHQLVTPRPDDERFDDHARDWHAKIARATDAVREWMRDQREAFERVGREELAAMGLVELKGTRPANFDDLLDE